LEETIKHPWEEVLVFLDGRTAGIRDELNGKIEEIKSEL
jgi:hypothetical protein